MQRDVHGWACGPVCNQRGTLQSKEKDSERSPLSGTENQAVGQGGTSRPHVTPAAAHGQDTTLDVGERDWNLLVGLWGETGSCQEAVQAQHLPLRLRLTPRSELQCVGHGLQL